MTTMPQPPVRNHSPIHASWARRTESRSPTRSRRLVRIARLLVLSTAASLLVWTFVTWRWDDPFTALYTRHQQDRLAAAYERAESHWRREREADPRPTTGGRPAVAATYRRTLDRGDPVGRLAIPRLDLDLVVANGADPSTLRKGPGRDVRSFVPGERKLVYIAGHRTTYLAPFSRIDMLRPDDRITLAVPYGTFVYRVTRWTIVAASDVSVLRSPRRETLALQTCHPRFFASKRYVVFARLVTRRVDERPNGGRTVAEAAKRGRYAERRAVSVGRVLSVRRAPAPPATRTSAPGAGPSAGSSPPTETSSTRFGTSAAAARGRHFAPTLNDTVGGVNRRAGSAGTL